MEPREYGTMFRVEDRHWWYMGMQRITETILGEVAAEWDQPHILDAGCGTGAALQHLARIGDAVGCDFSAEALRFCRRRGLSRLSQASVAGLPFADDTFDLITSFDVLCHRSIRDEGDALNEFFRVLKPEGYLLLRLPAFNWLHSRHDRAVHTARRFSAGGVRRALTGAGFEVVRVSYANMLLFPAALLKRLADRSWPHGEDVSDLQVNAPWQDRLLAWVLFAEAHWLRRRNLPFGLSLIALARKP